MSMGCVWAVVGFAAQRCRPKNKQKQRTEKRKRRIETGGLKYPSSSIEPDSGSINTHGTQRNPSPGCLPGVILWMAHHHHLAIDGRKKVSGHFKLPPKAKSKSESKSKTKTKRTKVPAQKPNKWESLFLFAFKLSQLRVFTVLAQHGSSFVAGFPQTLPEFRMPRLRFSINRRLNRGYPDALSKIRGKGFSSRTCMK